MVRNGAELRSRQLYLEAERVPPPSAHPAMARDELSSRPPSLHMCIFPDVRRKGSYHPFLQSMR